MMGSIPRAAVALAIVAALGACRGRSRSRAHDAAPAPDAAPATVQLVVDGSEVGRLTLADLIARRPLADTLPAEARNPDDWAVLTARSDDGRAMSIADVADRYRDHVATLYLDPQGRPALGLFAPIRSDQPPHVRRALEAPAVSLVGVTRIEIDRTAAPDVTAPPPADLVVVIDGRETRLDASRLDALPRVSERGPGHKRDGVELRAVLDTAGVGARATITVVGREGSATFSRADLDVPGTASSLRRNRRGQLRLAVGDTVVHEVQRLDVVSQIP